jgi:hypothetical protein
MTLTITDLATEVMQELGVLEANDTPSADDALIVQTAYQQWRRSAQNRQIIDWYSDDEEIPDGAERGVVLCVCNEVPRKFLVPRDPAWIIEGEAALSDYRTIHFPSPQTKVVNY